MGFGQRYNRKTATFGVEEENITSWLAAEAWKSILAKQSLVYIKQKLYNTDIYTNFPTDTDITMTSYRAQLI